MNRNYFKAVRPDGTDFHTGTVHWLPADGEPIPEGGWLVEHPNPGQVGDRDAAFYLSAATVETDCTGFLWPGRLLSVEPAATMWTPYPDSFPRVRAAHTWRVIEELPAWQLFGPQGRQVAAIIEQESHLTSSQIEGLTALDAALGSARDADLGAALVAALDAALVASLEAARYATWDVAWDGTWDTARAAARDAALGWLVKDLISVEDFRTLTGSWTQVMGPIEVTASTAHTEVNND